MGSPKAHWVSAYVLFRNEQNLGLLRFLKRNFRHCAVLLESDLHWLYVDQTFFQTEMRVWPKDIDPLILFKQEGWRILKTNPPLFRSQNSFRLGWIDCVSTVKRILGIKKWGVFTPFQLYCFLKHHNLEHF